LIVSGSNDRKIKVWSASRGECIRTLAGHDMLVRALFFDPATGRLVSASYDRSVKVWDLNTGELITEFKNSHVSHIFDVKFDARRIVRLVFRPFLSCPSLTLVQYFARPEDCGARFLRGVGHSYVRLNAPLLGDWISRTISHSQQPIPQTHTNTRTHTVIPHLGPPVHLSSFAFGWTWFNLFLQSRISQPFLLCFSFSHVSRLLSFLFLFTSPIPPPSPFVLFSNVNILLSGHQSICIIFQTSQTLKRHEHLSQTVEYKMTLSVVSHEFHPTHAR
jgi:hypothetical protein